MARRTFDVIDVCEIFTHWHAGRSKNEVAGSLGLARNTVRKYVAAAEAAGMVPGGPPVSQERWAELAREWFPELADARLRQVTWPAIEVHRDYIVAQLAAGVTMATIYQRLRDERGLAASVASLRRYVAANLPEEARRSQVTPDYRLRDHLNIDLQHGHRSSGPNAQARRHDCPRGLGPCCQCCYWDACTLKSLSMASAPVVSTGRSSRL